jgi:hypothetical protein
MKRALLALPLLLTFPSPAEATSLWGYSSLVTGPDARVVPADMLDVGASAIALPGLAPALTGYATYGWGGRTELSAAYGLPGVAWPTASVAYQVVAPSRAQPLAIAVGLDLLGVGTNGAIPGAGYHVAFSQDLSSVFGRTGLGTLHLGFMGDFSLNSRIVAGYELPIGSLARVMAEGWGPNGPSSGFAHLGAEWSPVSWWRVMATTLGGTDANWLNRGYTLGTGFRVHMPKLQRATPEPAPTSHPSPIPSISAPPVLPPAPVPTRSGLVSPPPLPAATLIARVVTADGRPMGGVRVAIAGIPRTETTTRNGYCFFSGLQPGHYGLVVKGSDGQELASQEAVVPDTAPATVTVRLP